MQNLKQKFLLITCLLLVISSFWGANLQSVKANAFCSGISISLEVFDVTSGQPLPGSPFIADGSSLGGEPSLVVDLEVPYGHQLRYDIDGVGTPSFTEGFYYTSGSYGHEEHSWNPNPTPGMTGLFNAPELTEDAVYNAQRVENECTATSPNSPPPYNNPPYFDGSESAEITLNITVQGGPPNFDLSCTPTRIVTQSNTPGITTPYTASVINMSEGYAKSVVTTLQSNPSNIVANPVSTSLSSPNYTGSMNVVYQGLTPGSYDLVFSGTDGTVTKTCPATLQVIPLYPEVNLKFNNSDGPTSPSPSNSSRGQLKWNTQNVVSCEASMDDSSEGTIAQWSGSKSTANPSDGIKTETISSLEQSTIYIFKLTCLTEFGTQAEDTVEVRVGSADEPPEEPRVNIKCQGTSDNSPVEGPCSIASGSNALLYWSSSFASSCSLSPSIPGYTVETSEPDGVSTGTLTNPPTSSITYGITCSGASGTTPVSDSVTINISVPPDPTISLNCGPTPINVSAGGSRKTVSISTVASDWDGSQVQISHEFSSGSKNTVYPSVSYLYNNPQTPNATTVASISAGATATVGSYALEFTATPTNGADSATCSVTVNVTAQPPVPPTSPVVTAYNSTCNQVSINWTPGSTPPAVTEFRVFRSNSSSGPWTNNISGSLSSSTTSFIDPSPSQSGYWYMVLAYNGSTPSSNSNAVLGTLLPCAPVLLQSDKDLIRVNNNTNSTASRCNGNSDVFSLPNNGIFKSGSRVYFKINICNTGNQSLTGLRVEETDAHNVANLALETSSGCTVRGSGAGPYSLSDLAPSGVCSLTISGTLTPPESSEGFLYRFWNIATIYSDQDSTLSPSRGPVIVRTPPYLFSSGSAPSRNETAP